jgi:hypothetical protein
MLCNPTKVPAVIIQALLPVSSQFGTEQLDEATPEAHGKLLRFVGGACTGVWANAECALNASISTIRATTGIAYLLFRNRVNLTGTHSESELDVFTLPGLTLHVI